VLIALWITAALLALVYLFAGVTKTVKSNESLKPQMPYVEDFRGWQVTVIGILEVLGALGVILPLATGIAPVITVLAAIGLVLVQIGAIIVHARRGEGDKLGMNIALLVLAAVVAVLAILR
jgi:uncharacterized membrane protein YphA (DoxX/SURF4 family)